MSTQSQQLIILGDINCRIGCYAKEVGKTIENGLRLLSLCQNFELSVVNMFFKRRHIW